MAQDEEAALTPNQAAVLLVLRTQAVPSTVREVADWLRLPRSSTQGAVMALVRLGLAEQAGSAASGGTTFRARPPAPASDPPVKAP